MHDKISKTKPNSKAKLDAAAMLEWYDRSARDLPWRVGPHARAAGELPNPYFVWLSEIMLQQTTVPTVGKYFAAFTSTWPTIFDLAAAPRDDVLKAWAGLGYYARARNLHACAQVLVDEHNGIFPASAEELQKLPGIGPYTSAAIAAICFDEQVAVVDGNVDRVVARYTALDKPVREEKPFVREVVARSVPKRAGDFAQSLMDLGATICAPKRANCLICPIAENCAGRKSGVPENYPVAAPKKPKPQRFGHAFVVQNKKGEIFLRQRPEKGLLAAMTEVPGGAWIDERADVTFPLEGEWEQRGTIDHVFTHFALEVKVWFLQSDQAPAETGWWQPRDTLAGEALPTAFKKVLAKALK
jgi:A/G-specific adenine glycosylase